MFTHPSTKQKVIILILGALCLVSVVIAIILLFTAGNNRQTSTEDAAAQRANTNIDAGLTELLKQGVTSYQIDSIKNGLYLFSRKQNADIVRMTMNIDSIERIVNNKGEVSEDYAIFTIGLDKKQYNVRVNLPGMSSAQVIVSEKEKQIFDSGIIDLAAQGINN